MYKYIKALLSFSVKAIIIIFLSASALAQRVYSPTPGEFPIVASTVFNPYRGPQIEDLEGVMECGFNVCMDVTSIGNYNKLLKNMESTNLKLLLGSEVFSVQDNELDWQVKMRDFVNRFKNHTKVAGWKFGDEPRWDILNALKERYAFLKKIDPNHYISFNLVGELKKTHTGSCKTLGAYLDSIQSKFDMDMWSSDYYPIWIRNGQFIVQYELFYADLLAFSLKSRQTGIPMWTYCESMEFTARHHSCPAATLPYLSFEAFSALAYGSQGIVYWTYWQRPSNSYETYLSALVDLEGNKTKAWYAAQKVNLQIRALTPVFLGAEMIECKHTGIIGMAGTLPFISDFGPLEELTNEVKGVLVSHLKNGVHDYLMVVNHDVQKKQKIKMQFKKNSNVTELNISSSGDIIRKKVKGKYNITLSPGGYALYEWE